MHKSGMSHTQQSGISPIIVAGLPHYCGYAHRGNKPCTFRQACQKALFFCLLFGLRGKPEVFNASLKIPPMTEAYDVALATHCPRAPITLAACLTVDFVSHNSVLQEQSMGIHYNQSADLSDYVTKKQDVTITEGYIEPLPKSGLGVEIDVQAIIKASHVICDWKNPLWHHDDGSLAEW